MSSTNDNIELAYASLAVIADDGTIDKQELSFLLGLALRDGVISDEERAILRNTFDRVHEDIVTPQVWRRISAVREKYGN